MKRKKRHKPYDHMTTAELREATKEFDQPFVMDRSRPLTAHQRALHGQAKRRAGRPRIGNGAARVLITVERGLLGRADAFAREHQISRSHLIARGLEAVLKGE